jgi:hypothetical protein
MINKLFVIQQRVICNLGLPQRQILHLSLILTLFWVGSLIVKIGFGTTNTQKSQPQKKFRNLSG